MARRSKRGIADVARYTGSTSAPPSFSDEPPDESITSGTAFFLISFVVFLAIVFGAIIFGTRNVEEDLTARATASLRAAGFENVTVEADGSTLRISGSFSSDQNEETAFAAVYAIGHVAEVEGKLWPVFEGDLQEIVITSGAMTIDWDGDSVTVAGTVASQERLTFIEDTLGTAFSAVTTDDVLIVDGLVEEPRWLGESLGLLIMVRDRLPVGKLIVDSTGELLVLAGETEDKDLRNDLNASVILLADGLGYDVNPAVRLLVIGPTAEEVEELQIDLDALLEGKVVEFETKSSELTRAGTDLLDEMLITMRLAPEIRIEIAGHTDSKGSAAANLTLSEERADAVLQYFLDRGQNEDGFEVVWFGEEQPTATNDTAEGRARNRRIEFTALEGTA